MIVIYKYRFEKILSFRQSLEKDKKYQLSNAINESIKEKDILNNLNNSLNMVYESRKSDMETGITISNLLKKEEEQNFYKKSIENKVIDVENADNEVKKKRVALIKAMQDKKILEKLKEVDLENHIYEVQKKTEKELDEMIGYKHSSN